MIINMAILCVLIALVTIILIKYKPVKRTNKINVDANTAAIKQQHTKYVDTLSDLEFKLISAIGATNDNDLMVLFTLWQSQRHKCNVTYAKYIDSIVTQP
jgi:hypothetical protein